MKVIKVEKPEAKIYSVLFDVYGGHLIHSDASNNVCWLVWSTELTAAATFKKNTNHDRNAKKHRQPLNVFDALCCVPIASSHLCNRFWSFEKVKYFFAQEFWCTCSSAYIVNEELFWKTKLFYLWWDPKLWDVALFLFFSFEYFEPLSTWTYKT